MKIAIVTEGYLPELSGVTISLHCRLRELSRLGHVVRVWAPDYALRPTHYPDHARHRGEIFPGVTVVPFPSRDSYVDYILDPQPGSLHVVHAQIAAFDPDVIHVECPERLFMGFRARAGVAVARRLGRPSTAIYHTNYLDYIEDFKSHVKWMALPGVVRLLRRLLVWVYNSYDCTMVPTPTIAQSLAGWGVRNLRQDGYNGVDLGLFAPARHRPSAEDAPVTVLYVGRLTPDKQIETLLRAFDIVAAAAPQVRFTLVGGGTDADRVAAWAQAHPGTWLPGRVPHARTAEIYRESDVFVTASTKENRPLSIQEAMASGLPIVAPRSGGIPDMIDDERSGLLVPPQDAEALAEALLRLVRDPSLRARLGEQARRHAERFYGWPAATAAMLTVWQELVERRAAGRRETTTAAPASRAAPQRTSEKEPPTHP